MNLDETLAWRRRRLSELAEQVGGKAALGRHLGYTDGAFVGQMIRGQRPITEKTIAVAERIRGPQGQTFKGWFTKEPLQAQAAGRVFEAITEEELELLDNFRHMLDHDRDELAAEIAARAARAKADIDKYIERMGLKPRPATASARTAAAKARAIAPAGRVPVTKGE